MRSRPSACDRYACAVRALLYGREAGRYLLDRGEGGAELLWRRYSWKSCEERDEDDDRGPSDTEQEDPSFENAMAGSSGGGLNAHAPSILTAIFFERDGGTSSPRPPPPPWREQGVFNLPKHGGGYSRHALIPRRSFSA